TRRSVDGSSRRSRARGSRDEAVGRRVVAALEGEGLAPTWDGSGASTITLERLRWYPVPGDA
ncbi:hypothetical protein AB4028_14335, partial [Janibacter sp. RAF20_2_2]